MAIASTDLLLLGSLNRPLDDTSTSGGGIDVDHRPEFTQLAATDTLEVLSSSAGDTTQSITITGRNAAGAIISDTKTLNGTTVVAITGSFERVHSAVLSADTAGNVTVRRSSAGPTVGVIPAGERGFYALFQRSASEAAQAIRYEKIFWRNNHGTLTLTSADVTLTADPDSRIRIGLATAVDDTGSVANRKTAPGGVTFSDDNVVLSVPGGNLAAGSAIGVWVEQNLPADDSPHRTTFTTRLRGAST